MKIVGKYIFRIFLFIGLILTILYFHLEKLKNFYFTNQTLNSIILFVLSIGIIYILRQLFIIKSEINWLNNLLKSKQASKLSVKSPSLLKYLDTFLKEPGFADSIWPHQGEGWTMRHYAVFKLAEFGNEIALRAYLVVE